jgi:hypothetical protein
MSELRSKTPFEDYKAVKTGAQGQLEKDGVLGNGPTHDPEMVWPVVALLILGLVVAAILLR